MLDRKIIDFDLSVRYLRCLQKLKITYILDLVEQAEPDLLRRDNFGRKSLREITDILESLGLALGMSYEDIQYFEDHKSVPPKTTDPTDLLLANDLNSNANALFKAVPWLVPVIARFLTQIVVDERATVAEALHFRGTKASGIKISDVLSSIGFQFFGEIYDTFYDSLSERHQIILRKRIHSNPSLTLEDLGAELGITKERARQLEALVSIKFAWRFKRVDVAVQSRVIRMMLGKVLPLRTGPSLVKRFIKSSRHPNLAFFAILNLAGPYKIINNWILRSDVVERVDQLRATLLGQKDRIGRIDPLIIDRETAGLFRGEADRDKFLLEYLDLNRIFGEWVAGDSQRKRIFLSLYKIGRPATKEEIANYVGVEETAIIGSYLAGNDFICRADKEHWAFVEWVDDPYDGIVGEIEQRIKEDGGKTTVERILTELPSKFGVTETLVRTFLGTPKFIVKDGYVRCATQGEINTTYFGDVEDVSSAVRLEDGCWGVCIKVEEQFLKGYSAAIPASIAWECGVKPGDSLLVPVDGTEHKVSVIWSVNSPAQTIDLGGIAPVLRDLGLNPGDEIVVAPSIDSIRIFRTEEAPIMDSSDQESTAGSMPIETLMKILFKK